MAGEISNDTSRFAEFVAAQDEVYERVVAALKSGRKETPWIWFIFPQLLGLGSSPMARKFGIASVDEAKGYLRHEILGNRLRECTKILAELEHRDIDAILGYPDNLKFKSCMTLFAAVAPEKDLFQAALDKYFQGEVDPQTLKLLSIADASTR